MGEMLRVVVCLCVARLVAGRVPQVLVVFPGTRPSHAVLRDSLVNTLLDAGHEVTYVRPHSSLTNRPGLKTVDIGSVADSHHDRTHEDLLELVRSPEPPQRILETGFNMVRKALEHEGMKELLLDADLTFDLVIAEWYYSGLLAPLATVYECPLIWYSGVDASWLNLQLVHAPTNPAHSVDPLAQRQAAASYSFRDRLDRLRRQAYLTAWNYYMTYYVEASAYLEIFRTPLQIRTRYPPSYEDVLYNASMLLINSHPLLGQSLALPANTKYVGGHHIDRLTKPLPENFQKLLDRSNAGLIFFTMGPNVKSKNIPEYMKRQLLDVFGLLEQTVLWEFEEPLRDAPRNVHVVKRALLSSILNHPNTVLVITNGEPLSVMEAAYFGVPIIGIPIFEDQFLTMDLVAARGLGVRVGYTEYLAHKVKDAVKTVLRNNSYHLNAKKASVIIQNPPTSAQRELLHWVEVVLQHGAEHLRSPALQLTTLERLHLDVLAVIAMMLWFLTKVWKVIKVHWNTDVDDKKTQ